MSPPEGFDETEPIEIPAGPFPMGTEPETARALASEHGYHPSWFEGEVPRREVFVDAFAIDRHPVTEGQYAAFCEATDHSTPPHWDGGSPPADRLDHPVVHVSRDDAEAYAAWRGKRLPTEAEWEKAARGTDGRRFPWGDEFDPERCHWGADPLAGGIATAPVDAHESGASPYGVLDAVGNVAEWCRPAAGEAADGSDKDEDAGSYHEGNDDPSGVDSEQLLTPVRGGAWLTSAVVNLRPASRIANGFARNAREYHGFRCVEAIEE